MGFKVLNSLTGSGRNARPASSFLQVHKGGGGGKQARMGRDRGEGGNRQT